MDYILLNKLSDEFSEKLEQQHVYYLDSISGFSAIYDRIVSKQKRIQEFLEHDKDFTDEFMDLCTTSYKEISGKDHIPMSLSFGMLQGDVKHRTKENGINTLICGANCLVSLYSYWQDYLRREIAIAMGLIKGEMNKLEETEILKNIAFDIWGDIRFLRNSIIHNNSIAISDVRNCKILRFFQPGNRVDLDFERMRIIFIELGKFRNILISASLRPSTIIIPRA